MKWTVTLVAETEPGLEHCRRKDHCGRHPDRDGDGAGERYLTEVLRVVGYNAQEDKFIATPMYTFARDRITA